YAGSVGEPGPLELRQALPQLAVFDPALGSFSGLGSIQLFSNNPESSSTFLFSVKYRRDGNPQGGLLYAERRGRRRVQSNSIQSLSVIGNRAILVGKATVKGVGNHTFRGTVVDSSRSGRGDLFGLEVISPSGQFVEGLTFTPIPLRGGNIRR